MSVQVLLEGYSKGGMGSTILCTKIVTRLGQEQMECNNSDATLYCWPVKVSIHGRRPADLLHATQ